VRPIDPHPLSLIDGLRAAVARAPRKIAIVPAARDEPALDYAGLGRALDGDVGSGSLRSLLSTLHSIARGQCVSFETEAAAPATTPAAVTANPEDAVILRLTGADGAPVAFTHRTLILRMLDTVVAHPDVSRDTVSAVPLDFATPEGVVAWLTPLWLGATLVLVDAGDETAADRALAAGRADHAWRGAIRRGGERPGVRLTVADGIRASARAYPERSAIVMGDERLTYRALVERIDRVAAGAVASLGLRPGERVAVLLPNCVPYLEIVCGFAHAGVPAALLPPMATQAEIRFMIEDCAARVLVCHASNEEAARAGAAGSVERVLVVGRDYEDWLARARPIATLPPAAENAIFSIPYTSGATGKPKGILLSHRSRILTAYAIAAEYRAMGPHSRMLVSTPVFHGAGFMNLLAPCWFGGEAHLLPRFSIEALLALIATHRITAAHLVPAHFAAFFALSAAERARYDLSSLTSVVSGTAPLSQAMKERIVEHFGPRLLHERYGSTEASVVTNLRPADQLRKVACVGQPFASVAIAIRDESGRPVRPGERGELWTRSPLMFSGYLDRPEAQAAALRDGWVSAGDIARQDEEGYVYLVDRKHDMIISGGENIYPREIEEILARHPAVVEVAVIGVPHDYWGEAVTAVVHLRAGMHASPEDLRRFCAESAARWKVPKAIVLGGPLPRNGMGKVLRGELEASVAARREWTHEPMKERGS
jgi:long-chain acyl-CoA synthetase